MNSEQQINPRESDRVEAELKEEILSLALEPGLAISEAALMERYGWGRTPLREAIQRLAEQSLLQIIPRHGVVVTALSVFDFVEMMDAMSMVIGPAAALACRHLDQAGLSQLDQLVAAGEQAAKAGEFSQVARIDYQFHQVLADATANRHLSRYLLHLHQVATRFNLAAWRRVGSAQASIDEHRQLVAVLQARDAQTARTLMLAHIEHARGRVVGEGLGAWDEESQELGVLS